MTDEHAIETPGETDAADAAVAGDNGRAAPAADDDSENLETKILSPEQVRLTALYRHRQLFAQAQEQFTAGEFVEANRSLKEIPEEARGGDAQRLTQLVAERIREVAELRSAVQTALNQGKHHDLQPKLLRLLELQPGDEWANTIRHRIEADEHARAVAERMAAQRAPVFSRPTAVPGEPPRPATRDAAAAHADAAAVEIVDDDAAVDEVWEFGERLVKSAPPPLKQPATRPQSVRVRPLSKDDDDFVGWLEPESSSTSTGVWIAIAVSGVVIFLALIATIVVLLLEKGK